MPDDKLKLTAEERAAYRESRDAVIARLKEAYALLQQNDSAALDALAEANDLLKQFKVITRTYLRRSRKP